MNRALIVLGGQRPARELLCRLAEETDYVLCADRGLDAALEAGIRIDGTKFAAAGYVSVMVSGAKVDELVSAKLTVNLQSDWTVTNPA